MGDQYSYDVFISYSHRDASWVQGELLTKLEAAGLKAMIDVRDFEIGAPSLTEMERAVETSRKTLLVLTPAYLNSEWASFENLMVQTTDPAARQRRIIPLLKEKCDLPLRLRTLTYVDFTHSANLDMNWSRLLKALAAPDPQAPAPQLPAPQASPSASSTIKLTDLRQKLIERTSLSDLRDLCFVMGIDDDNYPGAKNDFIRDLLADLQKWGRVDEFIQVVRQEKDWVLR